MEETNYTVADYLIERLLQLGITDLFGVPGDYNLLFLDHVTASGTLKWRGNNNELNAAYAADGYARVKGAGALVTTFGVGELSAVNGIAGSFAEYVPVVHIAGAPATTAERQRLKKHHTLCDGDYRHFLRMFGEVTADAAYLDFEHPCEDIDRVLVSCMTQKRPVSIVMPSDVAVAPCETPRDHITERLNFSSPQEMIGTFKDKARELVQKYSGRISLLADFLVRRFGLEKSVGMLLDRYALPYATLSAGKGLFDESRSGFLGIYNGAGSSDQVKHYLEGESLVISVGAMFTDGMTYNFTTAIPEDRSIEINPFQSSVAGDHFDITMKEAVQALTEIFDEIGYTPQKQHTEYPFLLPETTDTAPQTLLHQKLLWNSIGEILKPGDIVIAEQGTSFYGICDVMLPNGVDFIGQPIWGSIGYTLPAALGAQLAAPERRTVLFIGDGSALMTLQEIIAMMRFGTAPVVFLLNNDGYSIERAINGPEEIYNDIPKIDWQTLVAAMKPTEGQNVYINKATNLADLKESLYYIDEYPDQFRFVELMLEKQDYPQGIINLSRSMSRKTEE